MKQPAALDFERIYAAYGPGLYRFCLRLVGDRSEAEDLMQDVFIAAFHGKERFLGKSSVRTWLFRIAFYQGNKRRAKRRNEIPLDTEAHGACSNPEQALAIDQAIDRLPSKLRDAFVLVKVEELTSLEASEILGLPEGTVKFHIYEAVRMLRNLLRDDVEIDPPRQESTHAM